MIYKYFVFFMLSVFNLLLKKIQVDQKGFGAIIITVVVLSSILVVTLTASQIVENGIKMGQTQLNSTKAFFAAEAGAEFILNEIRNNGYDIRLECPDGGDTDGDFICFTQSDPQILANCSDSVSCGASETLYYSFDNETRYYLNFRKIGSTTLSVVSRGEYREGENQRAIQVQYACSDDCSTDAGCQDSADITTGNANSVAGYCCDSAKNCYECIAGFHWDGSDCVACTVECTTDIYNDPDVGCSETPIAGAHITGDECCGPGDCYECNVGMEWDDVNNQCVWIN
jgi:hypothetical protein